MLKDVDVGERSLGEYRGIAPEATLEGLRRCARDLQGARVLHVNATPYGGGVSELLRSVVPLLNDLGLVADWKIIHGDEAFFQVTKAIHNGLQGAGRPLGKAALAAYRENSEANARVLAESEKDPSIHVFTNLTGVGNTEVNAFQQLSDVVVQKSLREGFGLVVSEALWKGTPVVAGFAGGIPLQMADGVGGHLVTSVEECAASIVALLRDPVWAGELGMLGKERVRQHFLLPRLLLNELALMLDLVEERPIVRPPEWHAHRDPVCGMVVDGKTSAIRTALGSNTYEFCCEACRARFLDHPDRYMGRQGILR